MNFFVADPEWGWWIILYFYMGGLSAGSYFLATLIEMFGSDADRPLARIGFRLAFPLIVVCGIFLTVDLDAPRFWLTRDYLPEMRAQDALRVPPLSAFDELGVVEIRPLPVPHDCSDGFLGAFWRRPERYLEPVTRKGISTFRELDAAVVERAIERLRLDIASGAWRRNYGSLLGLEELDLGYRLVVSEMSSR